MEIIIGYDGNFQTYLKGEIFGSLGAVFSILLRNDHLQISTFSSSKFTLFQASIRLLTGIGAGALLVLCIKANWLFGALKADEIVLIALSIFAGFGERFIPEFIQTTNNLTSK